MKKFKSIATIFAFAVAIFGAAATDIFASNEEASPLATFYKSDCSQVTATCGSNSANPVCRTSYIPEGDQLFDKDGLDRCVVTIYKP